MAEPDHQPIVGTSSRQAPRGMLDFLRERHEDLVYENQFLRDQLQLALARVDFLKAKIDKQALKLMQKDDKSWEEWDDLDGEQSSKSSQDEMMDKKNHQKHRDIPTLPHPRPRRRRRRGRGRGRGRARHPQVMSIGSSSLPTLSRRSPPTPIALQTSGGGLHPARGSAQVPARPNITMRRVDATDDMRASQESLEQQAEARKTKPRRRGGKRRSEKRKRLLEEHQDGTQPWNAEQDEVLLL